MSNVAVLDANLTVLLVVGAASKNYIAKHKRLDSYTVDDFELLSWIIAQFAEIVFVPHVLAEVSNICRQIASPARTRIQAELQQLISITPELPIPSIAGVQRAEFDALGLTDAVLLHLCSMNIRGLNPTLITADSPLANAASSYGCSVIDYKAEYQT